jgi:hypothetical protein
MALFEGHQGDSGTHGAPDRDGQKWSIKRTARTLHAPVTAELWGQHLRGERPLGVIPIREDDACLWGSIDDDRYEQNPLRGIELAEKARLPLVPCRSKSGGLHLFLFLSEPQPAEEVVELLREMAASLGMAACEIFPKQTQLLRDRGDQGNWMVMPYYGGTFGGKLREQVGLRKTGAEMELREFLDRAEGSRLSAKEFGEWRSRSLSRQKTASRANGATAPGPFGDGPPCLQHMAAGGFPEGGRNNALFHAAVYWKKADPAGWQDRIEQTNRAYMKPPLTSEEVSSVVRSLSRRDYQYKCRDEPMRSHCDNPLCRTRPHGVGDGGGAAPAVTSVSKLDIEPPIWFVDVDGQRVECTTEQLQQYSLFQRACIERLGKFFRSMKQSDWASLVGGVMNASLTVIDAPPDAGTPGAFLEMVEEFCTNRARAEREEEIQAGLPWHDRENRRHVFRLRDLEAFLKREGVKDMGRGQITRRIERLGGGHVYKHINGKGTNLRWVPEDALSPPGEIPARPSGGDRV